jgi:hypothetical protein
LAPHPPLHAGDTEVGKSHTIRELMQGDEERPFVQRGADQTASTTFNVNLYQSRSLVPEVTVNFLDFEGEHGSEAPLLAGVSQRVQRCRAGTAVDGCRRPAPSRLRRSHLLANASSALLLFVISPVQNRRGGAAAGAGGASSSFLYPGLNLPASAATAPSAGAPGGALGAAAAAMAHGLGGAAQGLFHRAEAVREFFPKLAYTISDVVVVVGTEPFFST